MFLLNHVMGLFVLVAPPFEIAQLPTQIKLTSCERIWLISSEKAPAVIKCIFDKISRVFYASSTSGVK